MEIEHPFHLHPGEIFVTSNQRPIVTLLGSCVAVCLWDPVHKIAGMNHVVLPKNRDDEELTSRFANVATFVMFDMMKEEGAKKANLQTYVFGGASRLANQGAGSHLAVGKMNLEITLKVLQKLNLTVKHQDVGGEMGRRLHFNTETGKIDLKILRRFDFEHEPI